jgi:pimeloyl-ACP methyl ester carboxylesterase
MKVLGSLWSLNKNVIKPMGIKIRDIELKVSIKGDGPPLIWSHGLTSSMAYEEDLGLSIWKNLKGLKLIRFDARGHGLSSATYNLTDYRWSSLSLDLVDLIHELNIQDPILGGTSMGCGVSLNAAVTNNNCCALVLVNPPTTGGERSSQAAIYHQISSVIREGGIERLIDYIKNRPLSNIYHPIRERYIEVKTHNLLKMDARALPEIYLGAGLSDLPSQDLIRKISIPTIIFAWEGDLMHPVSTALRLHNLINGSELHVAKNLNDVKGWSDKLNRFLSRKANV